MGMYAYMSNCMALEWASHAIATMLGCCFGVLRLNMNYMHCVGQVHGWQDKAQGGQLLLQNGTADGDTAKGRIDLQAFDTVEELETLGKRPDRPCPSAMLPCVPDTITSACICHVCKCRSLMLWRALAGAAVVARCCRLLFMHRHCLCRR